MDQLAPIQLSALAMHGKLDRTFDAEPMVLQITQDPNSSTPHQHALLVEGPIEIVPGFAAILHRPGIETPRECLEPQAWNSYVLPPALAHLTDGDVVRINPRRKVLWVMYRRNSRANSLLLTERCNSLCVMCSQPPKPNDDSFLVDAWLQAVPLMSPATAELGLTGGEPLLLGDRFFELVAACQKYLPQTALHVLSNGRLFNYLTLARQLAELDHADLMVGIPLYSDIAWRHDFVVQTVGAFDQTVRGIVNLARVGVRIEIRVVIHQATIARLPELARFIARNMPFVEHVALMGLEPIGFGRANHDALWIDPVDTIAELSAAVGELSSHGLSVSIYNYQLCVLPDELWGFARQSISDWKNIFLPACERCSVRDLCGGLFHSATNAHSRAIQAIDRADGSQSVASFT